MNRDEAFEIITTYFQSWIEKDSEKFLMMLHDDAIVRECTGAIIEGRDELIRWFTEWNMSDNKVVYWRINFMGFDHTKMSAFVEWEFKCVYDGQEYEWDGSSIVHFRDTLISELNEYEMKKEKFYPYRN